MTDDPRAESKAEREQALLAHERRIAQISEMQSMTVDVGNIAVKSMFLINGGAAVALLAFMTSSASELGSSNSGGFGLALLAFAVGVALAAATSGSAYLGNYCYVSSSLSARFIWKHPYIEDTVASKRWLIAGRIIHVVSIIFAFGSLVLFLWGVSHLVEEFRVFPPA